MEEFGDELHKKVKKEVYPEEEMEKKWSRALSLSENIRIDYVCYDEHWD